METILVILIVAVALFFTVRMIAGQTRKKDGCVCDNNCSSCSSDKSN